MRIAQHTINVLGGIVLKSLIPFRWDVFYEMRKCRLFVTLFLDSIDSLCGLLDKISVRGMFI